MLIISLSLLFTALYSINAQGGIARFDTRNVRGYIRFSELEDGRLEINTNFSDLPFDYPLPYHVHVFPVDYRYDPTVRCGSSYTGGHHDPTNRKGAAGGRYSEYCSPSNRTACEAGDLSGKYGRLTNGTFTVVDQDLSLNGVDGILYRSVVIHWVDMGMTPRYVCATVEPTISLASTITARAAFYGNIISGNIYFLQEDDSSPSTKIFVNLNTVNTERDLANLDWNVFNSPPGVKSRKGFCSYVGESYNPRGRDVNNCNPRDASTCPESALTEKHGQLQITDAGNRYFFTEVGGITLYGTDSIIGRSITIQRGNQILACATIKMVSPIRLRAVLSNGFEISATQYFPFCSTRVNTSGSRGGITRLDLQDNGYISGVCDGSDTRYNPFVNNAGTSGVRTPDSSPLGDLLDQIPRDGETSMTSPIPLSGPFSAAERTIIYQDGATTSCTDLEYDLRFRTDNAFVLRASATFTGLGFSCMVHFSQLVTGNSYRPAFGERPSNPNFQSGDVIITDRCTNTTDREYRFIAGSDQCATDFYNPYQIMRQATDRSLYDQYCVKQDQRGCTVGNNLMQTTSNSIRSVVNTNVELSGTYGIASSGVRVQVNGVNCATVQVSGLISATYSVESCDLFNYRLGNAIDSCTGVESNTFLPISCSDDDINETDGMVSVNVDTVFAPGTNINQAQECILESISSGNKLGVSISFLLMVAIIILLIA